MKFEDFLGNEANVVSLRTAITRNRVANAYLFAGPAHVGKFSLALTAAKAMLCKNPEAAPCDDCSSCRRINNLDDENTFHPDLTVITPDGAFIKVDQIRQDLIEKVRMPPHESRRQVFIIDPAEKMHISAANAFLKSLEEAPGRSVFFLITRNQSALLPTIRSRCQIYSFQRLPRDEIAEHLVEEKGLTKDKASLISRLSQGAPGLALDFDMETHLTHRAAALDMVRLALAEGEVTSLFDLAARFQKEKESFPAIFDLAMGILRDVMLLKSTGNQDNLINIDLERELNPLAARHDAELIADFIGTMSEALEPLHRNVRIDTISENLMIRGRQKFRK